MTSECPTKLYSRFGPGAVKLLDTRGTQPRGFVEHFVCSVYDAWGRADVLVNNAGVSFIAPAESISVADYRRVLEVNLVAPFLMAKAFGSKMLAARRGCM
jgi:NAD(P)-dependent dehydrogenase (short-subunit alcohol dehydrogenase family)